MVYTDWSASYETFENKISFEKQGFFLYSEASPAYLKKNDLMNVIKKKLKKVGKNRYRNFIFTGITNYMTTKLTRKRKSLIT